MNEREKYEAIWQHPQYRSISPAETVLEAFLTVLPPNRKSGHIPATRRFFRELQGMTPHYPLPSQEVTVLDFGCGTGRAAARIAREGFKVVGVDIAYNALDEAVAGSFPFLVSAIEDVPENVLFADYSLCVDVLEHLPRDRLDKAIERIADCTYRLAFIRVANFEENHGGPMIGEPLHLSLMDANGWQAALSEHFDDVRRIWLEEDAAPERYTFVCIPYVD